MHGHEPEESIDCRLYEVLYGGDCEMSVMLNDVEENLYLRLDRMPGIALNRDKLYVEVYITRRVTSVPDLTNKQ